MADPIAKTDVKADPKWGINSEYKLQLGYASGNDPVPYSDSLGDLYFGVEGGLRTDEEKTSSFIGARLEVSLLNWGAGDMVVRSPGSAISTVNPYQSNPSNWSIPAAHLFYKSGDKYKSGNEDIDFYGDSPFAAFTDQLNLMLGAFEWSFGVADSWGFETGGLVGFNLLGLGGWGVVGNSDNDLFVNGRLALGGVTKVGKPYGEAGKDADWLMDPIDSGKSFVLTADVKGTWAPTSKPNDFNISAASALLEDFSGEQGSPVVDLGITSLWMFIDAVGVEGVLGWTTNQVDDVWKSGLLLSLGVPIKIGDNFKLKPAYYYKLQDKGSFAHTPFGSIDPSDGAYTTDDLSGRIGSNTGFEGVERDIKRSVHGFKVKAQYKITGWLKLFAEGGITSQTERLDEEEVGTGSNLQFLLGAKGDFSTF